MIGTPLAPPPSAAPASAAARLSVGAGTRALWLLCAGLLWTIPAWWEPRAIWLMVAWDAALLAAWAYDLATLPAPAQLHVTRTWAGSLQIGVPSHVALTVGNRSGTAVVLRLRDAAARELCREDPELRLEVSARGTATASYEVLPGERGDATMGPAVLSWRSGLGLARRWGVAAVGQRVRVYPDLREARRLALSVIRTTQLDLDKRRARWRTPGREFESLRDFREGDELRDVSWTATARRGRLVTRVYQPEQSQSVWLVVDAGRLTRGRVSGHRKLDHAANAAVALAQVAMARGDRVGLIAYGRRPQQRVAPSRGARHLRTLVDALASVRGEAVEGDHLAAASELLQRRSRRALVVWLTEIAETAGVPDVIEGGQQVARRHLVVLAVPQPVELSALAATAPSSSAEMYRVMAAQQTGERRVALVHSLRQRGVLALEWAPGQLSVALVDRYVRIKEQSLL